MDNWTKRGSIYYYNNFTEVNPGHIALFNVYSLAWPTSGSYTLKYPDGWVWYSFDTPQYLNKLYRQGWEVVFFGEILMDVQTNLQWIEDIISKLEFSPRVYMTTVEYDHPWDLLIDDRGYETKIYPTSFAVESDYFHPLVRYEQSDILPELEKPYFPSNIPFLAVTMGDLSSSVPHIADELATQGWKIVASTGETPPEGNTIVELWDKNNGKFTAEEPETLDEVTSLLHEGHRVLVVGTFPKDASRSRWIALARDLGIESDIIWSTTFDRWNGEGGDYTRDFEPPEQYSRWD